MKNTTAQTEELFNTIVQLRKLTGSKMQEGEKKHSTTTLQFATLQFLLEKPVKTVGDLARYLFLSKSSTAQLVDRLVKAEYVSKTTDAKDKRSFRLLVTPKGEDRYTLLKKHMMKKLDEIFSNLPEKDITDLIRIHTVLIENLRRDSVK